MCIRDRYQRRVHGEYQFIKELLKKPSLRNFQNMKFTHLCLLALVFLTIFNVSKAFNCFQVAQDFKCPYMELKCNGDGGSCKCNDGTYCEWNGNTPTNDNCPCDEDGPKRRKRRISDLQGL
eukprot:TRINITY_DN27245_c0_g1_i1.p2 TRINITY_DN27245_c0_g1~~TRINITY_DN27245_c0_g1_i1.p2  ORF type:complete len:121 (+),score=39.64 TRINITY_DN27245_c0_g1_i1:72-434(+)